ncbi:MAG: RluA family pseudouridine synthase [Gemmatimonadaceae bacterium]
MSDGDHTAPAGRRSFVVESDAATRLDLLVAARMDISRTHAATLIATGAVTVAGRRERASYRPVGGEVVVVHVPAVPAKRDIGAEAIPLDVVYEDDDVVVVNKAAGMVVHPAPGHWSGTLVNALKGRGGDLSDVGGDDREGIVHRLDKDTSGLLLVAKTDRAHRALGAAMQARQVIRRYAVLSWGHLESERVTVDRPIGRDPRDRKRMAIVSSGRQARTDFVRLARFDAGELLRAHLHTGRTHQIRVHLASIGHPVVGDDTYGGGGGRRLMGLSARRQFLHAAWLIFRQPTTGALVELRSPLPADLTVALRTVAGDGAPADHPDLLDHFDFFRDDR